MSLQTADNRHAIGFAAEMAAEFGLGEDVFARSGKINGAATAKGDAHNRDHAKHLDAMGEPYEMLDAAAMEALTGTTYYQSGLYTAGTAMLQPAGYIRGVAAGLASNRIRIHENSAVIGLRRDGGTWRAQTRAGAVAAPNVILAVNGHLNSFGFKQGRLMHVFTYASMTRPLTVAEANRLGGAEVWGLTPADPMGTTVRRIRTAEGSRIVIRNRFTFDPSMEVSDRRIARVGQDHDRSFAARFPMLRGVEMAHRWGGRLCLSRNGVNVVEELEPGLFVACCQNGLGTVRGTLTGMLAAELATGTRSDRLDRALAADAPTRLPPEPIARLGANAVLKWQERRAGAEL